MNERVREIRVHFHMTQRELAEVIGVSKGFISLVETGRSGLSEENIGNLCKALHIRSAWLKDGTGTMKSENPEDWMPEYENEEEKQMASDATAGRIWELRKMLRLTQKEFAEGMGSSREIVASVEQRRNRASEMLLTKIEKGYGVNREWLRRGQGEMLQKEEKDPQDIDQVAIIEGKTEIIQECGKEWDGASDQKKIKTVSDECGESAGERTYEMSMIDGFELVSSGRSKPFITLRDASITFSKMAIEALDYAEFVHMYIDKSGRRVAFQASEDDEDSFIFYRAPKPGRSMLVRLTTKGVANRVKELAGIESCENGLRYYGEYIEEEKLLIFDMKKKGVHAPTEGTGGTL